MTLACIALYRVLLYPIVLYVCLSFKSISSFHVKWPSVGPWWPQDRANIGSNRLKCIPRPPKSAPWNLEKNVPKLLCFYGQSGSERRDDDYLRRGLANEQWSKIKTLCFHVQNEHPKTGFVEKTYEKIRNGRRWGGWDFIIKKQYGVGKRG